MFLNRRLREAKIEKSSFDCRRGNLTVRGTEYRPQGDKLPIAIVCHGFMAFQDTVRQYAVKLAEEGYLSYCFDFCGGCVLKGQSDGKSTDMSVMTEIEDLSAVIEYAKSRPYSDEGNILLMGCSQGGLVAALTAARRRAEISKLVLFYPAFCIPDDARAGKMLFAKFDPQNIPDTLRCGPMKLGRRYVEDVINLDPFGEIKEYAGDVLIVHGTKDRIVATEYIERAAEAYAGRSAGDAKPRPAEIKTIENGKHMFSKKHDKIAMRYLSEFVSR